jgi:hypothetical protein
MLRQTVLTLSIFGFVLKTACAAGEDYSHSPDTSAGYVDRKALPDSFAYYGPQGIWKKLEDSPTLRTGRDTWFFWTGGNGAGGTQNFYRALSVYSSGISLQGKIQFYTLAQMSPRDRWEKLGLINEPNCEPGGLTEYGVRLDRWKGDPKDAYPTDPLYGRPTGIIGLRMFDNPKFDKTTWNEKTYAAYLKNPGKYEPPHLFGITCAFCHVAFDPLNPPKDPVSPRWENLAANIGNQYLHEGRLFFGTEGLFRFHDSRGLGPDDLVWQYGETQQRGTSETSRFSYDFLNNPNTINAVFYVGKRVTFFETTPAGIPQRTLHVLKDGADSVGLEMGLARVFVNIGMEGPYWIDHLWNPVKGTQQRPMLLDEIRRKVPAARLKYLDERYADGAGTVGYTADWPMGKSWAMTEERVPALISYLSSYEPMRLQDLKDPKSLQDLKDSGDGLLDLSKAENVERMKQGKRLFADNCAECHSNRQPFYLLKDDKERQKFYRESVLADNFLEGNTLSSDERIPVTRIQTNAARSLATNAIEGDIWADLSSREYKALPGVGILQFPGLDGGTVIFTAPAGGRGYYRPASLVSLWATAPYLHNNSVGPLMTEGKTVPDPSVKERVKLFRLGMRQMLQLDPRPSKPPTAVKVTTEECTFLPKEVIRRVVASLAARNVARHLAPAIEKAKDDNVLTKPQADAFRAEVEQILEQRIEDTLEGGRVFVSAAVEALDQQQADLVRALGANLQSDLSKSATIKPLLPSLRPYLQPALVEGVQAGIADLRSLVSLDWKLPKGFPINLLLNLRTDKVPYVALLAAQSGSDQNEFFKALLELSDCPDLIENHGHYFGTQLTEQEKLDLIEFLLTF